MLTKQCPAGLFCPEGQTAMPDLIRNACSEGRYCELAVSIHQTVVHIYMIILIMNTGLYHTTKKERRTFG